MVVSRCATAVSPPRHDAAGYPWFERRVKSSVATSTDPERRGGTQWEHRASSRPGRARLAIRHDDVPAARDQRNGEPAIRVPEGVDPQASAAHEAWVARRRDLVGP